MDPKGPKMAVLYRSPKFGKDCLFITNYEDLKKKKFKKMKMKFISSLSRLEKFIAYIQKIALLFKSHFIYRAD